MGLSVEDIVIDPATAEGLECAICQNLFEEPVQLLCGGRHIFCAGCVTDRKPTWELVACPACRGPLPSSGRKFVPLREPQGGNPHVWRMMNKLKVVLLLGMVVGEAGDRIGEYEGSSWQLDVDLLDTKILDIASFTASTPVRNGTKSSRSLHGRSPWLP